MTYLPDCPQVALEDEAAETVLLITDGPRSAEVRVQSGSIGMTKPRLSR